MPLAHHRNRTFVQDYVICCRRERKDNIHLAPKIKLSTKESQRDLLLKNFYSVTVGAAQLLGRRHVNLKLETHGSAHGTSAVVFAHQQHLLVLEPKTKIADQKGEVREHLIYR